LTAQVTGTSKTAVKWSISPRLGSISSSGVYTAPAAITSTRTVTVTATSIQDPTKSASATIQLIPTVTITMTPQIVWLHAGQKQQFRARVTGASNTGVTWVLAPAFGQISATGVYQAPKVVNAVYGLLLTAVSKQDPTKRTFAIIFVTP
jgi:hypothetical protein